jgi:hypothetical protein
MTTPATELFPAITWELTNEVFTRDVDERMYTALVYGYDQDGKKYTGIAEVELFSDEIYKVEGIEEQIN